MPSYGHIVMILGFYVSGSTAAAHWRCGLKSMGLSPTYISVRGRIKETARVDI